MSKLTQISPLPDLTHASRDELISLVHALHEGLVKAISDFNHISELAEAALTHIDSEVS
jgi:hypothetical protein